MQFLFKNCTLYVGQSFMINLKVQLDGMYGVYIYIYEWMDFGMCLYVSV